MPRPTRDLLGCTFGRLRVLSKAEPGRHGVTRWLCLCECGKESVVVASQLLTGNTASCGCGIRDTARASHLRHGHAGRGRSKTSEYVSWTSMMTRCTNPNVENYQYYGGRGITVCDRWRDFAAFLADMGPKPGRGYSIERKDNDGPYEPGNCRWATQSEQVRHSWHSRRLRSMKSGLESSSESQAHRRPA